MFNVSKCRDCRVVDSLKLEGCTSGDSATSGRGTLNQGDIKNR